MLNKLAGTLLVLTLLFTACGKNNDNYIPNVPVRYIITVQEFNIKAKNRILLVPDQGVAGLMIVAVGNNYYAFDRCSSVNPEKRCAVVPDDNGITATDPCSGAKFLLTDGSPQKAPAVRYLKSYQASLQGGVTINVSN